MAEGNLQDAGGGVTPSCCLQDDDLCTRAAAVQWEGCLQRIRQELAASDGDSRKTRARSTDSSQFCAQPQRCRPTNRACIRSAAQVSGCSQLLSSTSIQYGAHCAYLQPSRSPCRRRKVIFAQLMAATTSQSSGVIRLPTPLGSPGRSPCPGAGRAWSRRRWPPPPPAGCPPACR